MNIALLLEMAASLHPDRTAVSDGVADLSYAALDSRARAWGIWFRDHAGGRPVAYVGTSTVGFVEVLFGAAFAGVPLAPLNYRVKGEEMSHFLDAVDPATVVVEPRYRDTVSSLRPGVRVVSPDHPTDAGDIEAQFDVDMPAVLLFTSGTTARPKVVSLAHSNLASYVLATVDAGSAAIGEAVLLCVPPYHIAGVANVLSNVYRCRRIALMPQFDPQLWLEVVRAQAITHAFVVPTMLVRILDVLEQYPELAPRTLRSLAYGGSAAPEGLVSRALGALPDTVGLVNAFGLTETSSTVAVLTPEDHRLAYESPLPAVQARLRSAGRPIPGIEVAIVDESGSPVGVGVRGEIWLRGPQVAGGRLDTAGWLHTGDLGSLDDEGFLFIHGRLDDVIIRGGENIVPGEIEWVLEQHPAIRESAVVGIPDAEWGEVIGAVLVGTPIPDTEVAGWVREHLAGYKAPVMIHWCDELPRNDMGKVVRRQAARLLLGP